MTGLNLDDFLPDKIIERMAKYVETTDSTCTRWTGGKDSQGYPTFWFRGKTQKASRVLWELCHGPIPDSLVVMHLCDNPECLNLQHLQLGTHKDNTQDALQKGRMAGPRKLFDEDIQQAKQFAKRGYSVTQIAEMLGVSISSISGYLKGEAKRNGNNRLDQHKEEILHLRDQGYTQQYIADKFHCKSHRAIGKAILRWSKGD